MTEAVLIFDLLEELHCAELVYCGKRAKRGGMNNLGSSMNVPH